MPACSLPPFSPWWGLVVSCEGRWRSRHLLVNSQEQGSKGWGRAHTPSLSGFLHLGFPLREQGKVRTHWPHKTQALILTEGLPVLLGVLVASSRHQVQWDLLEGNLVLTESTGGRGTGLRKGRDQGIPSHGPLEQVGHGHCYGALSQMNPPHPLSFAPWLQRQSLVRSILSYCSSDVLVSRWWRAGRVPLGIQEKTVTDTTVLQGCYIESTATLLPGLCLRQKGILILYCLTVTMFQFTALSNVSDLRGHQSRSTIRGL